MSIDAHALMSMVDMSKLLDKENLEKGRVKRDGVNVKVKELIKAMMDSEPCLFHNSEDNLMPVSEQR